MAMSYSSATGYYSFWLNGTAVRASVRADRTGRGRVVRLLTCWYSPSRR